MPTSTKPTALQSLVVEQRQRARSLILAYVQGDEIDPQEFIDTAILNGKGVAWLQGLVETVSRRKQTIDAYHDQDFAAKLAAAKSERDTAAKANDAATLALTEAREAAHKAGERYRASIDAISRMQNQQAEAEREFRRAMKETAGTDPNVTDWENFSMA